MNFSVNVPYSKTRDWMILDDGGAPKTRDSAEVSSSYSSIVSVAVTVNIAAPLSKHTITLYGKLSVYPDSKAG